MPPPAKRMASSPATRPATSTARTPPPPHSSTLLSVSLPSRTRWITTSTSVSRAPQERGAPLDHPPHGVRFPLPLLYEQRTDGQWVVMDRGTVMASKLYFAYNISCGKERRSRPPFAW
ncbi:hypothetical protein BC936DRAFT_140795, partial [Jimgerdemannia flammicorona]